MARTKAPTKVHRYSAEFPGNLLVYAAASWLVMVRGGLWHRTAAQASGVF